MMRRYDVLTKLVGEQMGDLLEFDPTAFVDSLLE